MRSEIAKKVYKEIPESTRKFVKEYAKNLLIDNKTSKIIILLLLLNAASAFTQDRKFDYQCYYDSHDTTMDVLGVESKSSIIIEKGVAKICFGDTSMEMTITEFYESSHFLQICGNIKGQSAGASLTINRQRNSAILEVDGELRIELFGKMGFYLDDFVEYK